MSIGPWLFIAAGTAGLLLSPAARADDVPSLAVAGGKAPCLDGVWNGREWEAGSRAILASAGGAGNRTIRILETPAGLYLGLVVPDATPSFGRSPAGESLHREDVFEIFFEIDGDSRRYAELQISRSGTAYYKTFLLRKPPEVTATGRLSPAYLVRDFQEEPKRVPDGVRWAVGSDDRLWVVELFLPRRLFGKVLRANLAVHDWDRPLGVEGRTGRFFYWSPIESGCPHISPSRFGYLILRS
jgi:hypothetical protein